MKCLVIEDDVETAAYIRAGLDAAGHQVDSVLDGADGLLRIGQSIYDVIVVDRMLPGLDGLSVVTAMRAAAIETPVLILTTLDGLDDRVAGLNAGGDDYLGKPFAMSELIARLCALTRRARTAPAQPVTVLRQGDLELDLLTRTARRAGKCLDLLPREFQILDYLMRHAGQLVTRRMLLEQVWAFHFDPHTTLVETHMSRLRAKLDREFDQPLIQTVRGSGYVFRAV